MHTKIVYSELVDAFSTRSEDPALFQMKDITALPHSLTAVERSQLSARCFTLCDFNVRAIGSLERMSVVCCQVYQDTIAHPKSNNHLILSAATSSDKVGHVVLLEHVASEAWIRVIQGKLICRQLIEEIWYRSTG